MSLCENSGCWITFFSKKKKKKNRVIDFGIINILDNAYLCPNIHLSYGGPSGIWLRSFLEKKFFQVLNIR